MSQLLHGSTPESEFVLTTASDDDQECACEGCDNDTDDLLSLQLTCDVRGSLADYGEVGFCSMTCAIEFNREAPHETVGDDGWQDITRWQQIEQNLEIAQAALSLYDFDPDDSHAAAARVADTSHVTGSHKHGALRDDSERSTA